MKGMNKVFLIGAVGRDPEVRYTPNGTAVVTFSLATNVKYRDKNTGETKENVNWHNCVGFGKTGEFIEQYVRKGSKLHIEGSIDYQEYEKDGIKRSVAKITVRDFNLLSSVEGHQTNSTHQKNTADTTKQHPPPPHNYEEELESDSIPF